MNHIDCDVLISIIVPVFNNESLIGKCIESIINQTYKNWELIIVDDGSTDNSLYECKKYEDKDSRIKVIHQENQGVSRARYNGFKCAKGKWITFVDSDDTIPEDALESYLSVMSDSTDIIVGWIRNIKPMEDILTIDEYRRRNIRRGGIHVGPVAHLYRKAIVTDDVFDIPRIITMGEDMLMNIRISFNTSKPVKIVKKMVYNYFIENVNNTTNSHKISMEYEHILHKYRLKSIPEDFWSIYMPEMIGIRVYTVKQYLMKHPFSIKWRKSDFFICLLNDINHNGYNLNKSMHIVFNTTNYLVRIILIIYIIVRHKLCLSFN